jgi:hypothetical protein
MQQYPETQKWNKTVTYVNEKQDPDIPKSTRHSHWWKRKKRWTLTQHQLNADTEIITVKQKS